MGLARTVEATTPVVTSTGQWTATLSAPAGHRLFVFFQIDILSTSTFETRDQQIFDGVAWIPFPDATGTRVVSSGIGTQIVAQLEASIATSTLVSISLQDSDQAAEIDVDAMDGQEVGLLFPPGRTPAEYARMMSALLPPGRLWEMFTSTLSKLFLACADELTRIDARASDLLNESIPTTALELLPEYERELDLDAADTLAERRALIAAHMVKRQKFRPVDFQEALAPLLGQDAEDVVVLERTAAFSAAIGDVREIFRFFVYRDPTEPGDYFVDSAQDWVDSMKPSHTAGHVIESIDFLYDDPFSLYDRDLMGA